MAEDWAADVKRYVPDADDATIAGIIRYCGIALQKRDSSLVSFNDDAEVGRVRENFLKKKLGLTHPDADLDSAIYGVGDRMKGDNFKNRVTAYYLLTDHFGKHDLFGGVGRGAAAAAAGAGAAGLASLHDRDDDDATAGTSAGLAGGAAAAGVGAAAASADPVYAAAPTDTVYDRDPERVATLREESYDTSDREGSGLSWLWWLLGLLALGLLLWWLFAREPDRDTAAVDATDTAATATAEPTGAAAAGAAGTTDLAAAPAEGTVTIPEGSGVTVENRAGKPVVKVYFDTAKTDVAPAFTPAAAALKTYLDANSGSSLAISGYNDPTGNAAANAELAKNRAEAVQAALVAAGIAEGSTELVKPEAATDQTVDKAAARRVEVVVR